MLRIYCMLTCFVARIYIVTATDENVTVYNCYNSEPASAEDIAKYKEAGTYSTCAKEIEACDPNGYSRLDGSCNNLDYPAVGAYNTPAYWMVPSEFGENYTIRKMQNGDPLMPERKCRTEMLAIGDSAHDYLTLLFGYFINTFYADTVAIHDELNILSNTTTCCTPEGKDNDLCAPMYVPEDDPVHRFSGLRCMNMTKPLTFQYYGCAEQGTEPVRIGSYTHAIDMSFLYSTSTMNEISTFEGGSLMYEEEDGIIWPPQADTNDNCMANVLPNETRCFGPTTNQNLGPSLVSLWSYRLHNVIAAKLGGINPCWDDDTIYYTTRDIMIAIWSQINFYEMFPLLLGWQNMVDADIISSNSSSRDVYNDSLLSVISNDYMYTGRWFHTMQPGMVRMFDQEGYYLKEISVTNLTERTGYVAENIAAITQGSFRDVFGAANGRVDPNLADNGFGSLQWSSDILASDQARGRHYGVAPYIKYRDYCNQSLTHTTYDDIALYIRPNKLHNLKKLYSNVSDIELIVGMWAEDFMPGTECPYTLYCLLIEQLSRIVKSNRHWYESPNRPHAFTSDQLAAIRNVTVAYILCEVGDNVTEIQPHAFRMPTVGNEIVNCSSITAMNFTAWVDATCNTTTSNTTTDSNSTTTESSVTTTDISATTVSVDTTTVSSTDTDDTTNSTTGSSSSNTTTASDTTTESSSTISSSTSTTNSSTTTTESNTTSTDSDT